MRIHAPIVTTFAALVIGVSGCENAASTGTVDDDVTLEETAGAAALSEGNGSANAHHPGPPSGPPPFFADCRPPVVEAELIAAFDSGGDGELSPAEVQAARGAVGMGPPLAAEGDEMCGPPPGSQMGPPPDDDGAPAADGDAPPPPGFGAPPGGDGGGPGGAGGAGPHPPMHPMLHHLRFVYDANEDRALDDDEKALLESDLAERCTVRNTALLAEFDADGDGTLSADEFVAAESARADAFVAEHDAMRAEIDLDDDGSLSCSEREAAMNAHRAEVLTTYDANGNGTLDVDERGVLREDLREKIRQDLPLGPPPPL